MTTPNHTQNELDSYLHAKHSGKKLAFQTPEDEFNYASLTEKKCSKCGLIKKLIDYTKNTSGSDPFDSNGNRRRRPECTVCLKQSNRTMQNAKKLAKTINIPYKAPQGTKCALCGKDEKQGDTLVFDHCHKTSTFRGYLHNSCNRSVGVLGDNVEGLIAALNYLNITENKKLIITQNQLTYHT